MGPACPACKTRLPYFKTQKELGVPFDCQGCGQSIVVPRGQNWVFLLGLMVLFWLLKSQFATNWIQGMGLFIGVCGLGLPAVWLKTQVFATDTWNAKHPDKKKPPRA